MPEEGKEQAWLGPVAYMYPEAPRYNGIARTLMVVSHEAAGVASLRQPCETESPEPGYYPCKISVTERQRSCHPPNKL